MKTEKLTVHFDDSLPVLIDEVEAHLGRSSLEGGVVLREASGRLTFFADGELTPESLAALTGALRKALGPYARPDRVVADRQSPGAARILEDPGTCAVRVGDRTVRYLDRRIVGADWVRGPEPEAPAPPQFVFASLKGGVGRSTTLSVVAAEQARKGRNVLVIDMDLEAPGIGSILLDPDRRPAFGALDYLAESGLGGFDETELADFVGTSALTSGAGLVDVMPVSGTSSEKHPENFLAKLSRAMLEDVEPGGGSVSLRDKTRGMIRRVVGRRPYDLVLVDARAGMAELSAGPLLGLGATVFLFGTAQRQTIDDYRYLFAHLATLPTPEGGSPWRQLRMVHAKAPLSDEVNTTFTDEMWNLFTEYLYEEIDGLDGFNFDVNDPQAPHYPIAIPFDARFVHWDPAKKPTELTRSYYEATFGAFLTAVDRLLGP
ncbi:hypothetical protein WME73_46430 [Sorangium sp. So ce302]|uniref:KGGVGR-motif variant AAA ATPase n=1 Tax=Sorangium sp. So ce302 TaxID=3133297 RepID=UPI003F5FB44D